MGDEVKVAKAFCPASRGLLAGLVGVEVHGAAGHDGGDRVFVDHLRHGVAQQHNVLDKLFYLALQLDAVDQVNGHRHVFPTQLVQEWILQELAFVVAHDMLRVQGS